MGVFEPKGGEGASLGARGGDLNCSHNPLW
ncbi:MAG: hypothetical protein RLZZ244_2132 [Verrucomicrobiota bacterium]